LTQLRDGEIGDAIEWKALAGKEIIDASENERTAMSRLILGKLGARQPERPQDAAIEFAVSREIADVACERDPQEASSIERIAPEVDAGQRMRSKAPRGLFKCLAYDCLCE
jgi:hypothetical protein